MRRFPTIVLSLLVSGHAASGQLIPENATAKRVATGYGFTEGPALAPDGSIYFTDLRADLILRYDPQLGQTETARTDSGGANGLMFDEMGRLYACEGKARRVSVWTDGHADTIAERFEGKRFNSPNDLVLDAAGGLYFTDPRYGRRGDMEMEVEAVYYVAATGVVTRIIDDLVRPNGIMLSPDGRTLYVADNGDAGVFAYDVLGPGQIADKRRFADMERDGPDGMTVDAMGRLYAAGRRGIWVWEPTGLKAGFIPVPETPTNCAFGADGRTLYITAGGSLYELQLGEQATSDSEQ